MFPKMTLDPLSAITLVESSVIALGLLVYRINRCCGEVEENESEEDEPPSGMFS